MSDELDLVRSLEPAVESPSPDEVAYQRRLLEDHIRAGSVPPRSHRTPRATRSVLRAASAAAAIIIVVVVVSLASWLLSRDDQSSRGSLTSGDESAVSSIQEMLTPTTPAEYARGAGAILRFQQSVVSKASEACLSDKGVQVFRQGVDSQPEFAPAFEDPEAMLQHGAASVLQSTSTPVSEALAPGADPTTIQRCDQAGQAAAQRLAALVDPPILAWQVEVRSLDASPELDAAVARWRSCMAASGVSVQSPESVYSLLGQSDDAGGQATLSGTFARCLPALNEARAKARHEGRAAFLSAHQAKIPSSAELHAVLLDLSKRYSVDVPPMLGLLTR
jgi:hypothetical protein